MAPPHPRVGGAAKSCAKSVGVQSCKHESVEQAPRVGIWSAAVVLALAAVGVATLVLLGLCRQLALLEGSLRELAGTVESQRELIASVATALRESRAEQDTLLARCERQARQATGSGFGRPLSDESSYKTRRRRDPYDDLHAYEKYSGSLREVYSHQGSALSALDGYAPGKSRYDRYGYDRFGYDGSDDAHWGDGDFGYDRYSPYMGGLGRSLGDYDPLDYSYSRRNGIYDSMHGLSYSPLVVSSKDVRLLSKNRTKAMEHALKHRELASEEGAWRIPRVLHQTWKTEEDVPAKFQRHIASWRRLHPSWAFEFWSDRRCRDLVSLHFPEHVADYDRMSAIKRADVFRIVALHAHGGVYADIDVEAVAPLDDLLAAAASVRAGVLLGEENAVHTVLLERRSEWLVSNAVMASAPGHPFWAETLRHIFRDTWCGDDPVQCTGPRLVDRLSWQHVRRHVACSGHGCLVRLPFAYFSPEIARWNAANMVKECRSQDVYRGDSASRRARLVRKACVSMERALKYPAALRGPQTYAVHKWQCSWCREDATMRSTMSLEEILRGV